MSKTNVNILSALLIFVFILSCFSFFGVSAEDVENETTAPTEVVTSTTTEVVITTTTTTTVVTTNATVADPVYTSKTQKTTNTTEKETESTEPSYVAPITKETKDIIETETTTEPTTPAKNIVNYGSKYRPLKWVSLVLMISCVIALIAINVRYQKLYGKNAKSKSRVRTKPSSRAASQRRPQLDTNARFDDMPKRSENTFEDVDISSRRRSVDEEQFKRRKPVDDDIFGVNNNDDDLFI